MDEGLSWDEKQGIPWKERAKFGAFSFTLGVSGVIITQVIFAAINVCNPILT